MKTYPEWQSALAEIGVKPQDSRYLIDALCQKIADELRAGKPVRIFGVGTIELNGRSPRLGRNPKTGEGVPIPGRFRLAIREAATWTP